MDLSVLRMREDKLEAGTTQLQDKEPKLSYSIASLLETVQRAKAAPAIEREERPEENNEESDAESEISVDSTPDTEEDDRLGDDPHASPLLGLDPRLGVAGQLLRPGLGFPLQGLLPPGWPGLGLLHPALNKQLRPGNLTEAAQCPPAGK